MAETELQQGAFTEEQVDYGRASILLHDLFKQGYEPRDEQHTQNNHDKLAARYLKQNYDLPEEIIGCVDSHNGPWYEGKEPETLLEKVHHQADLISSRKDARFDVLEPCKELQDIILDEKTREEEEILERVNKLKDTLQRSELIWKLRIPGIGRVHRNRASKIVRYIVNGGENR